MLWTAREVSGKEDERKRKGRTREDGLWRTTKRVKEKKRKAAFLGHF